MIKFDDETSNELSGMVIFACLQQEEASVHLKIEISSEFSPRYRSILIPSVQLPSAGNLQWVAPNSSIQYYNVD